ncbi:uncharacterized protein LOC115725838 isoform X1 [Rhodamnia argentea]|uniref:Uncharacterized protein LOC115725838 isoform X1 n=1 Tax=Rhodamnia argentea TaxID=178133 RepID=A0A8B8MNX8_9MYRT|nr:uncharacterized protein LOC115725838 isoform X1 [Rhodamnia argentea]
MGINAETSARAKVARLEPDGETGGSIWSSELDHVPLTQRRNWLMNSRPRASGGPLNCVAPEGEAEKPVVAVGDALVLKKEEEDYNMQVVSGRDFAGNKCCSESEKIWICSVEGKSSEGLNQSGKVHEKNVQDECGTVAFDTSRDATAVCLGHTSGDATAVFPSRESESFGFPDNCLDGEPAKFQNREKADFVCSPMRLPLGENQSHMQNNVPRATPDLIVSNSLTSSKVKIEPSDDNDLLNQKLSAVDMSHLLDSEMTLNKRNGEIQDDGWSHELEHVPLLLRKKMLLAGKKVPSADSPKSAISHVDDSPRTSHQDVAVVKEEKLLHPSGTSGDDFAKNIDGTTRDEIQSLLVSNEVDSRDMLELGDADICASTVTDASETSVSQCCFGANQVSSLPIVFENALSSKSRDFLELQKCINRTVSKGKLPKSNLCNGQDPVLSPKMITKPAAALKQSVKVKIEPPDHHAMPKSDNTSQDHLKMLPVKREAQDYDDLSSDKVDHMLLRERLELLTSHTDSVADTNETYRCYTELISSVRESSHPVPESVKLTVPKRLRKRKKTATDSVETALDEDAPGLLKVLLDQGVTVDEIKLYGEAECNELVDESSINDGFAELEDVISKLFSQRQSFLKFAPMRGSKDAKISYCLACLLSLVEQTRYLRFRKWPAEWGWCRDLQSFIFVFERHNRIVLERPEYGYATYFFELVDSLPIDWQIKRLVIAMKLTSCSRVTLIENKALSVGEDLTEGEARVLMEYGWVPNTGLGTMLNYCDRVIHDQRNEMDTSEWRAKIGKLLIEGYNGGSIVPTNIRKITEHRSSMERENLEIAQVKMEAEL